MKLSIFFPLLISVRFDNFDKKVVRQALRTSLLKFEEIIRPIPELYKNTYKQELTISEFNNINLSGMYTFSYDHKSKTIHGRIFINKSSLNIKSVIIHEMIHAITIQILGTSYFPAWTVREGLAELISTGYRSYLCTNLSIYDDLINYRGYTEATLLINYFNTVSPGLLGIYLFCIKSSQKEANVCDKQIETCYNKPYNDCVDICNQNIPNCDIEQKICLDNMSHNKLNYSTQCNKNRDQCLNKVEKRCNNILRYNFNETKFRKIYKVC
jgi:hypothetical protein